MTHIRIPLKMFIDEPARDNRSCKCEEACHSPANLKRGQLVDDDSVLSNLHGVLCRKRYVRRICIVKSDVGLP